MNIKPFAFALPCLLGACARGPEPQAAHYPTLAASTPAALGAPTFEPATSLSLLALACRADEPSIPNALDDDCNGSIDDAAPDAGQSPDPVVLALSYPRAAPLRLALRAADQTLVDLTPTDCTPESAFCTRHVLASELPHGRASLIADSSSLDPATSPPSVVLSVQLHGKVTTYVAPIPPATREQLLGQLVFP